MKRFVIERDLPDAGKLTTDELQVIAQTSCNVTNKLGKPYTWVQSFVTDNKIYCIHIAESENVIREHSRMARFRISSVSEVKAIIDPVTSNTP